jgi:hypothetical protein
MKDGIDRDGALSGGGFKPALGFALDHSSCPVETVGERGQLNRKHGFNGPVYDFLDLGVVRVRHVPPREVPQSPMMPGAHHRHLFP